MTRDELRQGFAGLVQVYAKGVLSDAGLIDSLLFLADAYAAGDGEDQTELRRMALIEGVR
jgi:hypothetical protein